MCTCELIQHEASTEEKQVKKKDYWSLLAARNKFPQNETLPGLISLQKNHVMKPMLNLPFSDSA